jgi:Ca-activated chloride channel family protein
MSFTHPILLLSLLILPVAVLIYLWLDRRPVRHAMTFTNMDVLASVVPARSYRRYVAPLLALLALAALCFAVARPKRTVMVPSDKATVVLVIDVSGSMQATDVKPTRLAAAQAAVRKFLDKVPPRVRVALVAFAGDAQVVQRPTTNRDDLRFALDTIGNYGFNGTAIGDALDVAVGVVRPRTPGGTQTIAYRTVAVKKPTATILFLSDGHQTRGVLQPLEGAARAKEAGVPVYTIALGTPSGTIEVQGGFGGGGGGGGGPNGGGGGGFFGGPQVIPVPPDPATLRQIARTTGGKFFAARSAKAVESAYSDLGSIIGREHGKREATNLVLALAAILLIAAGVFSALFAPRLP